MTDRWCYKAFPACYTAQCGMWQVALSNCSSAFNVTESQLFSIFIFAYANFKDSNLFIFFLQLPELKREICFHFISFGCCFNFCYAFLFTYGLIFIFAFFVVYSALPLVLALTVALTFRANRILSSRRSQPPLPAVKKSKSEQILFANSKQQRRRCSLFFCSGGGNECQIGRGLL